MDDHDLVHRRHSGRATGNHYRAGKTLRKIAIAIPVGTDGLSAIDGGRYFSGSFIRAIDAWQPTLLVDEADAFLRDNDELRGLIAANEDRRAPISSGWSKLYTDPF